MGHSPNLDFYKIILILDKKKFPEYCIYDNACKLDKYCNNNAKKTVRAEVFPKTKFVVDRMHIKGHVGKECLTKNHPSKFPELKGLNTVICESTNFWMSGYKHVTKHMNHIRFTFFLYIICNELNVIITQGKISVFEPFKSTHSQSKKRDKPE